MAARSAAPPLPWGPPTARFRVFRPVVPREGAGTNGKRGASEPRGTTGVVVFRLPSAVGHDGRGTTTPSSLRAGPEWGRGWGAAGRPAMAGGREHRVRPGDTLPGLALRYGVTMEQIKRANRLYTSDTIFLKPTLLIPPPEPPNEEPVGSAPSDPGDTDTATATASPPAAAPPRHDLTATDFLRRLDADIGRSKAAAVAQRLRTGVPEAAVPCPRPGPSPRGPQLGAQPLTRTRRAAALRDTEDEIFTL
ncbi:LOW QUALITY PROTEIN: lysM and putative peptidoglycan-binding domain-containing protein 1 [Numida meleagris]|uniref:LOW QUALITY PROTEIN: lysM and putative peptidoglycan-binding domain-containing protein 1 n=1 Tax=Numida meleagris TaxID=8996 RepID=UPI000B3DEC77|nr:LOW QUALITY PROTEIN: lysM and putative peptidoglycan-binding domain-containing protein 1 [Numida meleagris]